MRKKIVAANWKMHLEYMQGLDLTNAVIAATPTLNKNVQVVFCTPFVHLQSVAAITKNHFGFFTGAQNCHQAPQGAFTGEVSASMIASVGASYVILGHSERRQYFGETDDLLYHKLIEVLLHPLDIIFCIGESLQERQAGKHKEVVSKQLNNTIMKLSSDQIHRIVIAYEPVWAIGTGLTATTAEAQEMHAFIRQHMASTYGQSIADDVSILYGGSCKPSNAAELFALPDVDGGLIGGASLQSADFVSIIRAIPQH